MMKLTERQRDLLFAIRYSGHTWHRPMDLGGHDSTDHSAVLRQLERKGLVESKQRAGHGQRPARGARLYRITDAGKSLTRELRPDPVSRQLGVAADAHAMLEDIGAF